MGAKRGSLARAQSLRVAINTLDIYEAISPIVPLGREKINEDMDLASKQRPFCRHCHVREGRGRFCVCRGRRGVGNYGGGGGGGTGRVGVVWVGQGTSPGN